MKISPRVRFLNLFRNIFRIPFLERFLSRLTLGKSPDNFFCRLVPNPYQYPTGSNREIERNGVRLSVDISDYIGHFLYFGFKDPGNEKLFSLCTPGTTVIDVGANIGWTALNLARRSGTGAVIGFEPDPINFERCSKNLRLNDLKNVTVHRLGLGAVNSMQTIETRTPENRGGNRIAPQGSDGKNTIQVVTLDTFGPVQELAGINLIKIDVEGYEMKVLQGASQLIKKFTPVLFIEIDDDNLRDQGDSASAVVQLLIDWGYASIKNAATDTLVDASMDFSRCHFDVVAREK